MYSKVPNKGDYFIELIKFNLAITGKFRILLLLSGIKVYIKRLPIRSVILLSVKHFTNGGAIFVFDSSYYDLIFINANSFIEILFMVLSKRRRQN